MTKSGVTESLTNKVVGFAEIETVGGGGGAIGFGADSEPPPPPPPTS